MTGSKKVPDSELDRIEEALVQAIVDATDPELREDMVAAGDDPEKCAAEFATLIDRAKGTAAKERFERAKSGLAGWRARSDVVTPFDREATRKRFEKIRARDPALASKMMMAARDGEELSDADLEGILEDLARLDRLESEDRD